jgi:hypothetical protein
MEPILATSNGSPCIEVDLGRDDRRAMTVSAYNAVQRQRYDPPLWARRVPPVEALSMEPSSPRGWSVRIIDQGGYNHQMRRLRGWSE